MTELVRLMTKNGDDTWEFNPKDSKSVADIKKKIKEYLDKGYYFYGAVKGETKMELLTKATDIEGKEFDRYILAAGAKRVLSPPPTGG